MAANIDEVRDTTPGEDLEQGAIEVNLMSQTLNYGKI